MILATVENMRRYANRGVFAYSPGTGERCSATPGDYFFMAEDRPLRDSEQQPMILARAEGRIVPLTTKREAN